MGSIMSGASHHGEGSRSGARDEHETPARTGQADQGGDGSLMSPEQLDWLIDDLRTQLTALEHQQRHSPA